MSFRSLRLARQAALLLSTAILVSCGREPTAPQPMQAVAFGGATASVVTPSILISQIYGAGGNSGALLNSDYIELFNPGTSPVSVAGWSVQYASTAGSTWAATPLTGTIQAGKYLLVKASGGANGSAIPTPDIIGTLNMAGGAGKVWLVNTTTLQSGTCPAGAQVIDHVSYGTGSTSCDSYGTTGTISTTLAALRNSNGCKFSANLAADFSTGAPAPRNSASAANPCASSVAISPANATVSAGSTQLFTAAETDGTGNPVGTAFAWTSSDEAVATISPSGLATGLHAGTTTITATATDGVFGTATLTVNVGGVAVVTVSPNPASVTGGGSVGLTASATDAGGNPVATTFTWGSGDANVATVNASGVVTGNINGGSTTITATAANGIAGSATINVTPAPSYAGQVVISQVYGGGGNANATYTNDFIEIFNRSTSPVNLAGWSVQYASSGGSFNAATPLSGTLQPGQYYLVQEASQAAVGSPLPAPDASATIAMAAGAGKVLLAQTTSPLGVSCPTGIIVVDQVSYGSGTNCGTTTPTISSTTAALRRSGGCKYTPDTNGDFVVGAPAPRNTAAALHSCVAGPLDHVNVTGNLVVFAGATTQLTAEAVDANDNTVVATFSWESAETAVATVNASGLVSGVSATGSPTNITVTALAGGVTKIATVEVAVTNPGGINWIDVSSRGVSMPPGFQTDMFVTARESQNGTVIPATFTFEAVDDANIAISAIPNSTSALLTALSRPADGSKPRVKVTATPVGGGTPYSFTTRPITVEVPFEASSALYGNNVAFGSPSAAGSNANDFLIARNQYVLSYNTSRGTPNWVSYELDSRQIVPGQDRCNCFTADPALPAASQLFVYDYTNSGYDRGHLAKSADRTPGNVDNAITFYMTNMTPQTPDLNQGVWARFENKLADSAIAGRAVYIVTGPIYSTPLHFVNVTGRAAIPDSMWKVALIGPKTGGVPFSQVSDWSQLQGLTLLAVNMPNVAGIRTDSVDLYSTTVEKIEQSTGYDILSLLSASMTTALEFHDRAPTASFAVSGTQNEGSALTFDASASSDADIGRIDLGGRTEGLVYSWTFGDGSTATGKVVTKTFADNGNYSVQLTVTDVFGWPVATSSSVAVANVAPTATFNAPGSVNEGSAIALSLTSVADVSSTDAGSLTYAFDCGTGSGYGAATASATASCATTQSGTRTVKGTVIDKDGGATEYDGVVTVLNVAPVVAMTATPTTIIRGESISGTGSFTDPGSDSWTATVNYGDGTGVQALALSGMSFSLSHAYATAGTFTVTVNVNDGDVTSTTTKTVTVLTAAAGLDVATAQVNALIASGAVSAGNGNSLLAKIDAAAKSVAKGNTTPALNQLNALLNEINALETSGGLTPSDAAALRSLITRIRTSLGGS